MSDACFPFLRLPQPLTYEILTVMDANQIYFTPLEWEFRESRVFATTAEHQALCKLQISYFYARYRNSASVAVAQQAYEGMPSSWKQMAYEYLLLVGAFFAEIDASQLPVGVHTAQLEDFAVYYSLDQARLYQEAIDKYKTTLQQLQSPTLLRFCRAALQRCQQQYTVAYIFAVADYNYESAYEALELVASADREVCQRFLKEVRRQTDHRASLQLASM